MANEDNFSALYPPRQDMGIFPAEISLAMAYIPQQRIETLYEPMQAYRAGTLYPELDKPFLAAGGK